MLLNGSARAKLTLDSGASQLVIKRDVVEKLNLKRIGESAMRGSGEQLGTHQVDLVLVDSLEIGGLKLKNVPAAVMRNLPLEGVIGLPVIGRFGSVELDFKKQKLRFAPYDQLSKAKASSEAETRVPFLKTPTGHILIDGRFNDHPCKVLVDTGSFVTLVSMGFLQRIGVGIRPPLGPEDFRGMIYGFSGSSMNWWMINQSRSTLQIGERELPVVPARRDIGFHEEALAFDPLPAGVDVLMGMSHLKDFILGVDYLNNVMTLKPAR